MDQIGTAVDDKIIVTAVQRSEADSERIDSGHLKIDRVSYDPLRTDQRNQALFVLGISGSGCFHDNKLVGICEKVRALLTGQHVDNVVRGVKKLIDDNSSELSQINLEINEINAKLKGAELSKEAQEELASLEERKSLCMTKMVVFSEHLKDYQSLLPSVFDHPVFNVAQQVSLDILEKAFAKNPEAMQAIKEIATYSEIQTTAVATADAPTLATDDDTEDTYQSLLRRLEDTQSLLRRLEDTQSLLRVCEEQFKLVNRE